MPGIPLRSMQVAGGSQTVSPIQAHDGSLRQRSGIGTQTLRCPVTQVCPGAKHCVQSRTLTHCAPGTQGPQQLPTIEGTYPGSHTGGAERHVTVPPQLIPAEHRPATQDMLPEFTRSAVQLSTLQVAAQSVGSG
jgi:hypothetical protein